ncbi:MAG: radical SAM protein [Candidatus Aminicenantes bacterium]|nr:radical SAM protein [Candidatus Aminicenantes bacterium]
MDNRENSKEYPSYLALDKKGTLSEREEKLYSIYENCHLCPRDCRVNRKEGQVGRCQATSRVKISSAAPSFDEEPLLVGKSGSGAIFFSNCGLRSVYSHDYKISIEGEGIEISDQKLAEEMVKLQKKGCHNINLVTPTHYAPNIVSAIQKAIPLGFRIPVVYNTRGYEKQETLQLLDGIIDIYLTECKYMDSEQAGKYSAEAYNYPHHAKLAIKEMYRQVGDLKLDSRGIAVRGLIVRHLILPNRIAGTEKFLIFIAENLSKTTYINIMNQYQPRYKASEYPEIARSIKRSEYNEALKWAKKYGLTHLAR